jgi:hypothetical protein
MLRYPNWAAPPKLMLIASPASSLQSIPLFVRHPPGFRLFQIRALEIRPHKRRRVKDYSVDFGFSQMKAT